MGPKEFKKVWNLLHKEENIVRKEGERTEWHKNGVKGWLEDGGYRLVMELPTGSIVECFDLYGKEVTRERRPARPEVLKAREEAARRLRNAEQKAAALAKTNDLVIPKEYRELVAKALKIAQITLEENKQPTWIVNLAQGKNKAKQIGWLLRNVVEAK